MSIYLEIPELNPQFPYRMFVNESKDITYPHWHKEIEIIYAKKGQINIGVNQGIITIEEGEIFLFASGQPHYFLASPDSERYVYQFDLKLFDESIFGLGEDNLLSLFEQGMKSSREWPVELTKKIENILIELHDVEMSSLKSKNYMIMGYLCQIMGIFYTDLPKEDLETDEVDIYHSIQHKDTLERLNKVFDYIENRYREVITIEKVASSIGLSPYYFSHFFKSVTGKTFIEFLTDYRVNQARFILASEKLPMVEVAEKSGFSSVKTFHHVFKKSVGESPLQYQKKIKKVN